MATEAINPNVDVNETQAPTLLTVLVLLMVASLVLVGLRLYTRMILSNKRFLEDYFILIGVVSGCIEYVERVLALRLTYSR